jgi:RNA polymerase sigma factor (sigma-70 family)
MRADAPFERLVQLVRGGDRTAAGELVDQYGPELRRRVRLLLSDRQAWAACGLSDIVQSVFRRLFVQLLDGKYDLKDPNQLIALLVTIGRNRITDVDRDPDNRVIRDSTLTILTNVADDEKTPSELVAMRELLKMALARMSGKERQILEAHVDGRSWGEIGEALGTSPDAARQKLNRARKRISKKLGLDGAKDA